MNLVILSRTQRAYSTRRLREAAEARGHRVRVLDVLQFAISLGDEGPYLYHKRAPIDDVDAVLPRIGASVTTFGTAVVRQFEQMHVFCANSSLGIANSRDKLRALQILRSFDLRMPATEFVRTKKDVLPAIERVGGVPVVIKLIEGTQGIGVILADKFSVAAAIIETLQSTKQNVLIQKFVAESKGRDVRALVVGDRVVAAMRRVAQGQEFRSNVHRGGRTEVVELDPEYAETAVSAAQILGLRIAGVDMLEGKDGPEIMEVNSSPGLEGIEGATGVDVAGEVIGYIEERGSFPDMDIRQRLTVSEDYGVSELVVSEGSALVGKSIAEAGLRDLDILVLSLDRDGTVIPNPSKSRVIEANDHLLCYGKLESMRSFIPTDRPRPKPRRVRRKPRSQRS